MSEVFQLNSTDFEALMAMSVHHKLSVGVAQEIIKVITHVSRRDIIFTRLSLRILLTLLGRFENNTQIYETCQDRVLMLIEIMYD